MRERETLPERYLTAVVATSVPRGDEWDLEIAAAGHARQQAIAAGS